MKLYEPAARGPCGAESGTVPSGLSVTTSSVCGPVPSMLVKNSYVTVPVAGKPGTWPLIVAVSRTDVPSGTGEMTGTPSAPTITVAEVDVPRWTTSGSTALVEAA